MECECGVEEGLGLSDGRLGEEWCVYFVEYDLDIWRVDDIS